MKVLSLLCALLTAPTWDDKNYSVTYALVELTSTEGMHDVLERMETLATTYCTDYLLISSYPVLRVCRHEVVMELANEVDDAPFRDFVRQSQNAQLIQQSPMLMYH